MSKRPSEEEIQFYLKALNRTENAATVSIHTDRCRAIGVANLRKWFKENGLKVSFNEKARKWELSQEGSRQ